MTIQTPLLAAFDSTGTVRTFEYSGGVFVQTGSLGGLDHTFDTDDIAFGASAAPFLYWNEDDTRVSVLRASSTAEAKHSTLDRVASAIGEQVVSNGSHSGSFRAAKIGTDSFTLILATNARSQRTNYASGDTAVPPTRDDSLTHLPTKMIAVSPDYLNLVAFTGAATMARKRTSADNVLPATWSETTGFTPTISADLGAWANNKSLVIADASTGRAQAWRIVADEWELVHELSLPAGTPKAISASPDSRFMAISVDDGGTFTTRIFRRTGDYFTLHQDLAGIGALLDWTVDGVLILDCAKRVGFERQSDDSFAVKAGVLASLPVAVTAQAVSHGQTDIFGWSFVYDAAVSAFASGAADLADLKLTLLTSGATFDRTQSSLAEVTDSGALEISGGGWPAGGLSVGNVTGASESDSYDLQIDQLKRVIIETDITFRYAVIYDNSDPSDQPLIFIDLIEERTVTKNRELVIDFRDGVLLSYRS